MLRGCVFAPEVRAVAASVEEAFGYAEAQVVSFADLYGGKIMAALDRNVAAVKRMRGTLDGLGAAGKLDGIQAMLIPSQTRFQSNWNMHCIDDCIDQP